jgi:hypothetical protein
MDLEKFLEKYLPDYQAKSDKHYEGTGEESESDKWLLCEFYDKYFPEALQNFADRICDEQKQLCADIITERLDDHECEPFEDGIYVTSGDILDAEHPKIEDL